MASEEQPLRVGDEQTLPTYYSISNGDLKQLEFDVELTFVGTAFGDLPSFERILEELSYSPPFDRQVSDEVDREFGKEKCSFLWQQSVPKIELTGFTTPTKITEEEASDTNDGTSVPEDPGPNPSAKKQELEQHINTRISHSRIFTYTNSQLTKDVHLAETATTDSKRQYFRPKKVTPVGSSVIKNPIVWNLSEKQRSKNKSVPNVEQSMLIMAYLGALDSTKYDQNDEYVLMKITLINNRLLKFSPDLGERTIRSHMGNYKVRISVKENLQFDTLASEKSAIESERETEDSEGYASFEVPEKDDYWINYLISIDEGFDFSHDGLSIEYMIELPENVSALHQDQLTGRTQICFSKGDEQHDRVKFSYPIEFTLIYSPSLQKASVGGENLTWPRLNLRVLSEDLWQRYFVDGYTSVSLPIVPGKPIKVEAKCWRVINPYDNVSALREQHIGQAIDLNCFELAGAKDSNRERSKIWSKVGLCTMTSGTLGLSIQCLHQCRQYLSQDVSRSLQYGALVRRTGINEALHRRITRVLEEFELAKRQLLRVQQKRRAMLNKLQQQDSQSHA